MGRPRIYDESTASALVAAAERVAEAEGVAAVSVRRVADEVATSTRAVYSLFGSKDGLLVALATRGFRLLAAAVEALPVTDDPLTDAVRAGAVAFRGFVREHPVLFRISFQQESVPDEVATRFAEARSEALHQLTARLDRVRAHPDHRALPRTAAMPFHAMCEGLAAMELRGAISGRRADAFWADGLRAVLTGLSEA